MTTLSAPRITPRTRTVVAEFIGTAFLLIAVVGSGIQAQRLFAGNTSPALLEYSAATGAALIALILGLGPISGAHFNPVVTLVDIALGRRDRADFLPDAAAQVGGAIAGVFAANSMFGLPVATVAHHSRTGFGLWLAEMLATFGLILVIYGVGRRKRRRRAVCGRLLYRRGVLVHRVAQLREPGRHAGPRILEYVRQDIAGSVIPFIVAQLIAVAAIHVLYPRMVCHD